MTVRMRLRRWARTQGKRRAAARTKRSTAAGSRRREQQTSGASQLRLLRLTVCGALFVSLVLLKLVLPGNLSAFRGTLAQWLVRDADFTEAFSAIGHAVAAPERFAESLGNAYVAVFGGSGMQDAAEVGGGAEIAHPDGMRTCPSLFMMFTFLKTAFFSVTKKDVHFSAEGHASCQKMNVIAHQIYK